MTHQRETKGWKLDFDNFFMQPTLESLRVLLQNHVGESAIVDFKGQWPAFPKVARHLLGIANSGCGCLIVGVEERDDKTFQPIGVDMLIDKNVVRQSLEPFIPKQLSYEVLDFEYRSSEYAPIVGKKFQVVCVEDTPEYVPFVSMRGGEGIGSNAIYCRRGTSTEPVNYAELQELINRRISTQISTEPEFTLGRHLAELRALYDSIPRSISIFHAIPHAAGFGVPNPHYPKEDLGVFFARLITQKKAVIEAYVSRP